MPNDAASSASSVLEEGRLLDYITGKIIKDSAKERVRQHIARALFHEYGISVDDMAAGFKIPVDGRNKAADIAIFEPGTTHDLSRPDTPASSAMPTRSRCPTAPWPSWSRSSPSTICAAPGSMPRALPTRRSSAPTQPARGQGPVFHPQGAVDLMVAMLDPKEDERFLDPACGTERNWRSRS